MINESPLFYYQCSHSSPSQPSRSPTIPTSERTPHPSRRDTWAQLRMEYDKAVRYYTGDIFRDKVETEAGEGDAPLLYPVGINLVKLITLSMTDALFGEHDDSDPVLFVARNNNKVTPQIKATIEYLSKVLSFSHAPPRSGNAISTATCWAPLS